MREESNRFSTVKMIKGHNHLSNLPKRKKASRSPRGLFDLCCNCLFAEVTLQQTGKCRTVARFVFAHFVDGIMDGIQIELLGFGG